MGGKTSIEVKSQIIDVNSVGQELEVALQMLDKANVKLQSKGIEVEKFVAKRNDILNDISTCENSDRVWKPILELNLQFVNEDLVKAEKELTQCQEIYRNAQQRVENAKYVMSQQFNKS